MSNKTQVNFDYTPDKYNLKSNISLHFGTFLKAAAKPNDFGTVCYSVYSVSVTWCVTPTPILWILLRDPYMQNENAGWNIDVTNDTFRFH